MLAERISLTEVVVMDDLYNNAVVGIEIVLKHRYKMSALEARSAIDASPLKNMFMKDAEIAAHTSNETWARDIYEFWEKCTK